MSGGSGRDPATGAHDADRVEALLVECIECAESEGRDAVDRLLAHHPDLADAVRRRLALLDGLDLVDTPPDALAPTSFGDFRRLKRIGRGGMGDVYLAEQCSLRRKVALKVIRPGIGIGQGFRERLRREARAAARVNHPHIVSIYASGEVDGCAYIAMEFVPGEGLDEIFAKRAGDPAAGPIANVVHWCTQIAHALSAAHAAGLVHRDVKPSNIRITPDGNAKLLDFGLVRDVDEASLSTPGSFVGSPHYASPEQVSGDRGEIGPASDVYSLGATLYEGVTGTKPFNADTAEQLFHQILSSRPRPPRRINPAMSRDLGTVVSKAMEPFPPDRYASARTMAEDLEAVAGMRSIAARPPTPIGRLVRWARREPARAIAAVLGLVVLVLATYLVTRPSQTLPPLRQVWESAEPPAKNGFASPDGRYIVYVDWADGNFVIRDLVERQSRKLTSGGNWEGPVPQYTDGVAAWSPNSRRVAYQWFEDKREQLRVIDAGGGKSRVLLEGDYPLPHGWTADGSAVLVTRGGAVATVSVDGGEVRVLHRFEDRNPGRVSLSPDGRHIAYHRREVTTGRQVIFTLSLASAVETRVVGNPEYDYRLPHWTPDGAWLVFGSDRLGGSVWSIGIDGGRPRGEPRLVKSGGKPLGISRRGALFFSVSRASSDVFVRSVDPAGRLGAARKVSVRNEGRSAQPAWSPDGTSVAFFSQGRSGRRDLEIRDLAARRSRFHELPASVQWVDRAGPPRWSSRGVIAVCGVDRDVPRIWLLDVSAGECRCLRNADARSLAWSPDGRELAMVLRSVDRSWSCVLVDVETGTEKPICEGGREIAFAPDGDRVAALDAQAIRVFSGRDGKLLRSVPLDVDRIGVPRSLQWARDGEHVFCLTERPKGGRLFRIALDSGRASSLGRLDGADHVQIDPAGRRLAYTGPGADRGTSVWIMENLMEKLAAR